MVKKLICYENDVFLRNKYSPGLLRSARNDVSGEGGEERSSGAPPLTKIVIVRSAARKQSSANNAFRRNAALLTTSWLRIYREKK